METLPERIVFLVIDGLFTYSKWLVMKRQVDKELCLPTSGLKQ